jgi:acetyl-CoA carboxylase biotin carboxyl carrier protein
VDLDQIEGLIKFLKDKEVAEFEYGEDDGVYLRIKLIPDPVASAYAAPAAPVVQVAQPAAQAAPAVTPDNDPSLHDISSPMVGTFYSAASPDTPPFAKVGDKVQVGQTICIIEAMKLMNEIEADASGVIEAVMLENAQPVQFGQVLFKIRAG